MDQHMASRQRLLVSGLASGSAGGRSRGADIADVRGMKDVNHDGRMDLVARFGISDMRLSPDDTFAVLRGHTRNARIVGFDRVRIVPALRPAANGLAVDEGCLRFPSGRQAQRQSRDR
jgi:hypothetical protein